MSLHVRVLIGLAIAASIVSADAGAPLAQAAAPAPGAIVAIYQPERKRFVKLGPGDSATTTAAVTGPEAVPANGSYARFRVVDGGNGKIALHSIESRRFLRLPADNKASSAEPVDALPDGWQWERMELKRAPAGAPGAFEIFNPATRRSLRMSADGTVVGVQTAAMPFRPVPAYPKDGLYFELAILPTPVGDGVFPAGACPTGTIPLIDLTAVESCRRATEVSRLTPGKRFVIVATDLLAPDAAKPGPALLAVDPSRRVSRVAPTFTGVGTDLVFEAIRGFVSGTVRLRSRAYGEVVMNDSWQAEVTPAPAHGDLFALGDPNGYARFYLVHAIAAGPDAPAAEVRTFHQCLMAVARPPTGLSFTTDGGRPGVEPCDAKARFRFFELAD